MKRRSFIKKTALAGLAGAAATSTFPTPAISQGKIQWNMTTTWPKNFPALGTGANYLAETITKASGGRLSVKVFGAGELVPAFDAMDAVSNGTAQIGHGGAYYWKGKVPATQFIAGMPFGLNAQEQNAWMEFGDGNKLAEEAYSQMNVKFFACGNTWVQAGGWYNQEMTGLDSYKGLKMRIPGLGGEVIKAAGGTVVNIPGGEILSSMQSGAIDATEWVGPYNDLAFGLHKVAKHYYYPGWHEPGSVLDCFINMDAWNALPKDLQAIVETSAQAATLHMMNEYTARNASALATLRDKHKVDIRPFPDSLLKDMKKLSHQVIGDIAAQDPLSQKVYDSLWKFQKDAAAWTEISEFAYMKTRKIGTSG